MMTGTILLRRTADAVVSGSITSSSSSSGKQMIIPVFNRLLLQSGPRTSTRVGTPMIMGSRPFHSTSTVASSERHGTTIICVRKNGKICMMGDGMVSQGNMIVKPNAKKIRRISPKGSSNINEENKPSATLVGFAGSTADAFTLMERLEAKLDEYPGQLTRSCVELAKGWRTDKYLRRLEASLIVANMDASFELTGNGDVLESYDGVLGIGSGSPYAIAAARALIDIPELSAEDVARKAMVIASNMCVYTNEQYTMEILDGEESNKEGK